jgi:hypothetical protein
VLYICKKENEMINVTIGEIKPQEKPFPKLMQNGTWVTLIFFVNNGKGVGYHLSGTYAFEFVNDIFMVGYSDYNEPITIQNA